ncbi:CU044_2847 family protein [Streptomyces sp. NPDC003077]|uniref:CU044_2847 family protein n=1 Tax=Streptomyces sp. NPDC003077 TaxID=3154443 RepID=UPI0033AF9C5D
MSDRARRIELPDGTEVWARVSRLDTTGQIDPEDEFQDVGAAWDALTTRVEGLGELITGVATSVRAATRRVAPDETSVTFGIEVSAKPGRAVALLAEGGAKANLSVSLTWRHGGNGNGNTGPAPSDDDDDDDSQDQAPEGGGDGPGAGPGPDDAGR